MYAVHASIKEGDPSGAKYKIRSLRMTGLVKDPSVVWMTLLRMTGLVKDPSDRLIRSITMMGARTLIGVMLRIIHYLRMKDLGRHP